MFRERERTHAFNSREANIADGQIMFVWCVPGTHSEHEGLQRAECEGFKQSALPIDIRVGRKLSIEPSGCGHLNERNFAALQPLQQRRVAGLVEGAS